MSYTAINFRDNLAKFSEHWSPRVVAEMNDYQFKVVKLQDEFVWHSHEDTDETFLVLDGLGLIAFTLIGCSIAREAGHAMPIVLIAGMLTGAFGGVLRDILCNEVPLIFQKELYAIIALLTGAAYLLLLHWGVADATAILCCLGGGFALRLLAIHYRWEMPKFVYHDEVH